MPECLRSVSGIQIDEGQHTQTVGLFQARPFLRGFHRPCETYTRVARAYTFRAEIIEHEHRRVLDLIETAPEAIILVAAMQFVKQH
jgi:hypothetical protein